MTDEQYEREHAHKLLDQKLELLYRLEEELTELEGHVKSLIRTHTIISITMLMTTVALCIVSLSLKL